MSCKLILVSVTFTAIMVCSSGIETVFAGEEFVFNRTISGVSFSPYVKTSRSRSASCMNQYTFEELKTMLEVVSTKFSRVLTESMDALNDKYTPNYTYYNNACIIVRTAEAAAIINREREQKSIQVMLGVRHYSKLEGGERKTKAEMYLAIEAFEIANLIFPGTVETFHISNVLYDNQSAVSGSSCVDYLRNQTLRSGVKVKVGIIADLSELQNMDLNKEVFIEFRRTPTENRDPKLSLLAKVDYLTVNFIADTKQPIDSPTKNFASSTTSLFIYDNLFQNLTGNIKATMGYSGWINAGNYTHENSKNLGEYWKAMNDFAEENTYPMWFHEAFDIPWKTNTDHDSPYYGWWRLEDNEKADDISEYLENILSPRNITIFPANTETIPQVGDDIRARYIWILSSVAFILGGLIFTILIVGSIKLYKMKTSLQNFVLSKQEIRDFNLGSLTTDFSGVHYEHYAYRSAMEKPYDRKLEILKENLDIHWHQILGTGQFGSVHKAILRGPPEKIVALKTTKAGCSYTATALRGLLSEIKILAHLGRHPNIVSICGAYTAEITKGIIYVALELCTMGSLKSYLSRLQNKHQIDARIRENLLRWSCEIATGMEHIGRKGVIHADLAARNVLLTHEYVAKISDFGLSRRLYEYGQYIKTKQEPLPWRWMALESLKMRQFSCESDVWSFGVTLWEIFSLGAEPYSGYSFNASFIESLESGLATMSRPHHATQEIFEIMLNCWQLRPDMRPTFSDLKTRIEDILTNVTYDAFLD